MADFHGAGNRRDETEDAASIARNSRVGLILFAFYFVLYAFFVLLNTFSPSTMEWTPWAGINLDVLYGFALIVSAVVLALVYGCLCSRAKTEANGTEDREVRL